MAVEHKRCSNCGLMQAWPSDPNYKCKGSRCHSFSADRDALRPMRNLGNGACGCGQNQIVLKRKNPSFFKRVEDAGNRSINTAGVSEDPVIVEDSNEIEDLVNDPSPRHNWAFMLALSALRRVFCRFAGTCRGPIEEKERAECQICIGDEASVVILPCGHGQLCKRCLQQIVGRKAEARCPTCRQGKQMRAYDLDEPDDHAAVVQTVVCSEPFDAIDDVGEVIDADACR